MTAAISDVSGKAFDYVIVGGGTSGLALAARLTEDPAVTVAVLEAGQSNFDDPKILVPGQFGGSFYNPQYDWNFRTVKQTHSNNVDYHWARGKGLGGSSALNFYAWIKPPARDVDIIEELGNPGWNWKNFEKYSQLTETFHEAAKEQADLFHHTYNAKYRGTSGPIHVTVPYHVHTIDSLFQQSMVNIGAKAIEDPYGGDITGTWMASANLDPKTWTRSYTATAYLTPHLGRSNLTVITDAHVSRVLFADSGKGAELTASGVDFIYDGATHTVNAKKEVILSAGTIKSPQILELSGIGNPKVLSKISVETKINLPGVGENVQDHLFFGISYELDASGKHATLDLLRDPAYAANALKLHAEGKGPQRVGITSYAYLPLSLADEQGTPAFIEKAAHWVKENEEAGKLSASLVEQYKFQLETLRDSTLPDMEMSAFPGFFTGISAPEPGKTYVSLLNFGNHPFSRGTIHATSNDPLADPEIDPHYYENQLDLDCMVEQFKFARKLATTEPFKSAIVKEVDPGPEYQTKEKIEDYIKTHSGTAWHAIGSCSMLPREKQGVVDSNLKVYGTTNLRVVDISIVPLHIAAHTHATALVIGEKAADMIRGVARV